MGLMNNVHNDQIVDPALSTWPPDLAELALSMVSEFDRLANVATEAVVLADFSPCFNTMTMAAIWRMDIKVKNSSRNFGVDFYCSHRGDRHGGSVSIHAISGNRRSSSGALQVFTNGLAAAGLEDARIPLESFDVSLWANWAVMLLCQSTYMSDRHPDDVNWHGRDLSE